MPCPDAEVLAAWLDRGLGERERAGITAHVAGCDDCRSIVSGVLAFEDAPGTSPGRVVPMRVAAPRPGPSSTAAPAPSRVRGKIVWAGGIVAAAAAIILAVGLQPGFVEQWRAERRLTDLAEAAGTDRTVEARLTGGFAYGPLRAPVRSGGGSTTENWSLLAAAGRIRDDAAKNPVAENLHNLGVAALVLGEHDEAIRALEDATSEEPESGRFQSDLAAAYLARAQAADRPDDLTRGLTAAERALAADHALLEARFNKALALERLYLTDQARKAWQEYLEYDPSSPWSTEARQHLEAIPEARVEDGQAKNNSPPKVASNTVEAALDWILRVGLAEWADAVLAGDLPTAERLHSQLLTYAESVSSASGDPFASTVVGNLKLDPKLAGGVRGYSLALETSAKDDLEGAGREFVEACPRVGQPLRSLCALEAGSFAVIKQQGGGPEAEIETALSLANQSGFVILEGSALRLRGWRRLAAGDAASSMEPYLSAYKAFVRGHYAVRAGLVADQVANLFDMQGLTQQGWHWRLTALGLAAARGNAHLSFITRTSASGSLQRRGAPEAALAFADAIGQPDPSSLPLFKQVIRERLRVAALLAIGNLPLAEVGATSIQRELNGSTDFRAERMRQDLMLLRAKMALTKGDDERAESALDEALASMGAMRLSQRISALLARSRLRTRQLRTLEAEGDVREAIQLLVGRASSSSAQALELTDAQPALDAVSALVHSRADLQSARGLILLEQLREVLDGAPVNRRIQSADELLQAFGRMGPDESLIYYLFAEDGQLAAWVVSKGGISFVQLQSSAKEISALVNLLTVQVARAPANVAGWRSTLEKLHRLLVGGLPPLGRDLIIVPDGILNRVPFGSLLDPRSGAFLFERQTIRLAPNFAFAIQPPVADGQPLRGKTRTALVVGDPSLAGASARSFDRLPGARAEARVIARLYDSSTLLVGADATRDHVLRELPGADVLHFAGHAVMSGDGRRGARLLLAGTVDDPATTLRIGDVSENGPKAPVRVVLAACGTAAASGDRASGVASLAATFLRAGSQSVVGTLWPVEDGASEEFFVALHRGLTSGNTMASALAEAQRTCRASETCRQSVSTWLGTAAYGSS